MEASKCPKCGEEPHFVEAVEKWYCYGCNEYIEDCETTEDKAEPEAVHEGSAEACKKCGAELERVADGKLYCYICGSYPDEAPETAPKAAPESAPEVIPEAVPETAPATPIKDEAQALLDSIPSPVISTEGVDPVASLERQVEPKVEKALEVEKAPEVKMCSICGQPMKWIEKYERHYCYGCRKYASKDVAESKPEPSTVAVVHDHKSCPECKGDLKFIEKYNEYYCYSCKKYPLRAKRAPAEKKSDGCPKCGKPLTHVAKYDRDYCYACKQYAPKRNGSPAPEKKVCPSCSSEMKYVSEYNEWYCYKCKKYSLRPTKPVLLF
jgi:ssDNA-binding Zn-finger/Zn-ribbon topoisomerase 1